MKTEDILREVEGKVPFGEYETAMSEFLKAANKVLRIGPATGEMSAHDAFEDMAQALSARKPKR